MAHYHQGKFNPKHPEKYVGDVSNIVYRSSWEKKCLVYFDNTPSILKYSSEETVIPYVSPVDSRVHRYFVDFTVMFKDRHGVIKRAIVEIKPYAQTIPPVKKSKTTKRFLTEVTTYSVNQAKWRAAEAWAKQNNFQFMILSEKDLGL